MKLAALIISSALLVGCSWNNNDLVKQELPVVKQTTYVVRIPPKELMTLPAPVAPINVDTAKQSDVAQWLLLKEDRANTLENMLKDIATFFKTEQDKMDAQAADENQKAKDAGVASYAAEAASAAAKPVDAAAQAAANMKTLKEQK